MSNYPENEKDVREDNLVVCRCEDVTVGDIRSVLHKGVTDINEIKRITRAGMGLCQGRICEHFIRNLIAQEYCTETALQEKLTVRPPLRPTKISHLMTLDQSD